MFSGKQCRRHVTVVATLCLLAAVSTATGQEMEEESYRAWAVNMGTVHPGGTTTLQIHVTRWSTDEERQKLFAALVEKDRDGLLKVMGDLEETGWIRLDHRPEIRGADGPVFCARAIRGRPGMAPAMGTGRKTFPSERLRYAREFQIEDKRRLVLALDRPIPYWEAVNQPRTIDYGLTMIVLDLDKEGEGEGRMAIGVEVTLDKEKSTLELENFSSEPVRLMEVHKQ